MAYLILEEGDERAELSLSLNGLPLGRATPLRSGDRIGSGRSVLRFVETASQDGSTVREPTATYRASAGPPPPPEPGAEEPRAALARSPELVAEAPCMRRLLARVRKVAARESSVLILGESGTGKELIAQAIRSNGPRAGGPFVPVNAAALPREILESELFGHERGSFTGAHSRRRGLFEVASGGTLFLDEVGELAPATQAKLLRVLETGEIRRVGGDETLRVDVRLICATHRDLRSEAAEGTFREDLFFRIAVVELHIPPLRERPEDLGPLVRHLLSRHPTRVSLAPEAMEALRRYPFPGNVRELRNFIESALNFVEGDQIGLSDLPPTIFRSIPDAPFQTLAEVERAHIEAALRRAAWNKTRAATLLGIDRKTLYGKIDHYGLGPVDSGSLVSSGTATE